MPEPEHNNFNQQIENIVFKFKVVSVGSREPRIEL